MITTIAKPAPAVPAVDSTPRIDFTLLLAPRTTTRQAPTRRTGKNAKIKSERATLCPTCGHDDHAHLALIDTGASEPGVARHLRKRSGLLWDAYA